MELLRRAVEVQDDGLGGRHVRPLASGESVTGLRVDVSLQGEMRLVMLRTHTTLICNTERMRTARATVSMIIYLSKANTVKCRWYTPHEATPGLPMKAADLPLS